MFHVAVVGYGYWGPNLVRNFLSSPETKVTVVDSRAERLQAAKLQFPMVEIKESLASVLGDSGVAGVAVATPVYSHYEVAKSALEAGKHVLVEKPLTSNSAQAKELIDIAKKNKRQLMVDHTYLYSPAVKKIKALAVEGVLGNIRYFDSTRINLGLFQPDINVLWDLAVHDLSILNYLIEENPVGVQAMGVSHTSGGNENIAYLALSYDSGFIAHFNCSWSSPVKVRHVLVGGDKKMVLFDDLQPTEKVKVYDTGYTVKTDEEKRRVLVDYRVGDINIPYLDKAEPLSLMVKDFIASSVSMKDPVATAESGLKVVRILEAAQVSIKNRGKEVLLKNYI